MTSAPTSATKTNEPREYTVVVALRGSGDDREFLMVRHAVRGWELPGGKIEAREGPVRAAFREFREETGHLLVNLRFVAKFRKENGTAHVFCGQLGAEAGKAPDVVESFAWFRRLPLEDLAFPDDPYEEMGRLLNIQFR